VIMFHLLADQIFLAQRKGELWREHLQRGHRPQSKTVAEGLAVRHGTVFRVALGKKGAEYIPMLHVRMGYWLTRVEHGESCRI
jgi:hypothetical protein